MLTESHDEFSPAVCSSAGKSKGNGSSCHGNRYLARVLGESAVVADRTATFLGERYRRGHRGALGIEQPACLTNLADPPPVRHHS